jgi:hypothetical protein
MPLGDSGNDFHNYPQGSATGRLLHLRPGGAMTVDDPSIRHAAGWVVPLVQCHFLSLGVVGVGRGGSFYQETGNDPERDPRHNDASR